MPAAGYCKLCKSPYAAALNKLIVDGKNSTEISTAMEPFGLKINRRTLATHTEHVTHPLLTAVERAQQQPLIVPKSNRGVLEAIRDLGIKRAMENPDEVTVDHAIKAADLLQKADSKGDNVTIILAQAVQGQMPAGPMIEGEYRELEGGMNE